jgi:phosphatidylserine/phosphatidylglycerophosphate/cardiolipin synthase-like enzyme
VLLPILVIGLNAAIVAAARSLPAGQVEALAACLEKHPVVDDGTRTIALSAVAAPAYRSAAKPVLAAAAADAVPGPSVALALRVALNAVDQERQAERIHVVWTGPTTGEVPVRLTREALVDVVRAATRRLIVVSFAAYKVPEVVAELKAAMARGVDVRLVLEDEVVDGAAAFAELAGSASLWVWPSAQRPKLAAGHASMHAKAAVADGRMAFVTSANLTGHAIAANMELGLVVDGGPVPRRLEAHLLRLMSDGVLVRGHW